MPLMMRVILYTPFFALAATLSFVIGWGLDDAGFANGPAPKTGTARDEEAQPAAVKKLGGIRPSTPQSRYDAARDRLRAKIAAGENADEEFRRYVAARNEYRRQRATAVTVRRRPAKTKVAASTPDSLRRESRAMPGSRLNRLLREQRRELERHPRRRAFREAAVARARERDARRVRNFVPAGSFYMPGAAGFPAYRPVPRYRYPRVWYQYQYIGAVVFFGDYVGYWYAGAYRWYYQ